MTPKTCRMTIPVLLLNIFIFSSSLRDGKVFLSGIDAAFILSPTHYSPLHLRVKLSLRRQSGFLSAQLKSPPYNYNSNKKNRSSIISHDGEIAQNDDDEIEKALERISSVRGFEDSTHDLCKTQIFSKQFSQSILSASPDRLALILGCRSIQDKSSNVVDGISHKNSLLRHPAMSQQILNPGAFVQSTEEWFCNYLGLSPSDEKKIYSRWPNAKIGIQRLGRHRLHEWLAFFLSPSGVGMNPNQLKKIILSRPRLPLYKLSNIQSTTAFFREELGLTSNEYTSILVKYPSVLMYSIDQRLRPTINFLQNDIGGGKDNWDSWRNVIQSYPQVFSHSLEKTLLPKLNYYCNVEDEKTKYALGLNRSELSQVVSKFPPTLWLGEENLTAKIEFLWESLGLNKKELRALIVSYPQILGLSLKNNLSPKMDFFLDPNTKGDLVSIGDDSTPSSAPHVLAEEEDHDSINCGLSKNQLKEFVLYQPALLAYSLENRLKPRISRMQKYKISFIYVPKGIMSYTNDKFEDWLSTQMNNWSISE